MTNVRRCALVRRGNSVGKHEAKAQVEYPQTSNNSVLVHRRMRPTRYGQLFERSGDGECYLAVIVPTCAYVSPLTESTPCRLRLLSILSCCPVDLHIIRFSVACSSLFSMRR
ncbi:hypothetical protein M378DRAFT_796817 [Amanita muscaria Koide BX008]|uniref:Uncharacterized protein n=1 Tax=Amanita muscaria (strain Koide BX008) TaxID=946122 RepID=A0A0C2T6Z1_AMAMK|nr:hypothetical protein M378DRAFT_796817 [Amanita muscaria Koide BX008]